MFGPNEVLMFIATWQLFVFKDVDKQPWTEENDPFIPGFVLPNSPRVDPYHGMDWSRPVTGKLWTLVRQRIARI